MQLPVVENQVSYKPMQKENW